MSVADPPETDRFPPGCAPARAPTTTRPRAAASWTGWRPDGCPGTAYADLAAQHWFIYETLEQAAQAMADDPVAGDFVLPRADPAAGARGRPGVPGRAGLAGSDRRAAGDR